MGNCVQLTASFIMSVLARAGWREALFLDFAPGMVQAKKEEAGLKGLVDLV